MRSDRSWLGATALSTVVAALALVACSPDDPPVTRAAAATATEAGTVDPSVLVGGTWHRLPDDLDVDGRIVQRCAELRGDPSSRSLAESITPMVNGASDAPDQRESGYVRVAVRTYVDDATARASMAGLNRAAFGGCVVAATNAWIDERGPSYPRVPHTTGASVLTIGRTLASPDQARLFESTFDAEVLGGMDQTYGADLFVARAGPVVVTVAVATDSQLLDPRDLASLARRIGVASMTRAGAALED